MYLGPHAVLLDLECLFVMDLATLGLLECPCLRLVLHSPYRHLNPLLKDKERKREWRNVFNLPLSKTSDSTNNLDISPRYPTSPLFPFRPSSPWSPGGPGGPENEKNIGLECIHDCPSFQIRGSLFVHSISSLTSKATTSLVSISARSTWRPRRAFWTMSSTRTWGPNHSWIAEGALIWI